jgi:alginate O-acetyltransferase complex protein AlgJ
MTVHDPLSRERRAHDEIGRTEISRPLAVTLTVLFLLAAVAVPVAELTRPDGTAAFTGLFAAARRAAETAAERGLLAGNRELLAAMNALEDRLEEESALARLALPPAQWLQTAVLGAGNEQVLLGRDRWLYFVPAVDHLAGPGFLDPAALRRRAAGGESWQPRPNPDPLAAILALRRDLASRGIALVVLPTPVKPALHPDRLVRIDPPGEPLRNPSWDRFVATLESAGIPVVDPAPPLLSDARATGEPQFLATDTHWTPAAVERTAALVAARLESEGLLPPSSAAFRTRPPEPVTGTGDLVRLLELPDPAALYPPQTVEIRRVDTPDGRPWTPDPAADVLLLGDSYTNVFSQPALGWGESAGLAEHISLHLARPVDRIAVNAGGAHTSRARLYDLLAHASPRLAPKRLVIYQFSTRELSHGDWILYDPETARPLQPPTGRLTPLLASRPPSASPESDQGSGRGVGSPLGSPSAAPQDRSGSSERDRAADEQARAGRPPHSSGARRSPGESPRPAPATAPAVPLPLGDGYVVWESNRNRTGDWRIFHQRLDGTGLRQLSPDDDLQHCCPHISPDGTRIAYLARAAGKHEYPETEIPGPLRLLTIDPATGASTAPPRTLAESARTYGWGDRAAVWRSDRELIHVTGDGRTALLDLRTGDTRPLTTEPRDELGWLIDRTLRWATNAAPSFSRYDPEARRVIERRELGGCEPYFTHDGRWGVFMPAGGGPINRIDPETREITTILRKWDPRLPGGEGYLYFPMPSRDGRLLAFGASAGGHDHFRTDYNIYAAPTDPETLELEGAPVRLTDHPATDRYPDVWLAPLPLGRHTGEAPLEVDLAAPGGAAEWDLGDGTTARGAAVRHTYAEPGSYEVTARRGGETLRGRVVVQPARPPQVVEVSVRSAARELEVVFDEPVRLTGGFRAALGSGTAIAGQRLESAGRRLVLSLGAALAQADTLRLDGVTDLAQRPNPLPAGAIAVAPPTWPSDRRALAFLWQTGDQPNEVFDAELRADVADPLTPHGRARLDRFHRMVLGGGWYTAAEAAGDRLLRDASRSNELTLEATIVPAAAETEGLARIVTFSGGPGARNLTLGQEGRHLVMRIRTGPTGQNADRPQVRLFPIEAGKAVHVVVTYVPGVLIAYRNGERILESRDIQGGLNRWRRFPLAFGAEPGGVGDWSGTLEGVAIYSRLLDPREVRENFLRYRDIYTGRSRGERAEETGAAGRLIVRATLEETSAIPTLRQITPYRRALAVYAWRIEEVLRGRGAAAGDRLRVAHWVLLDGERTPAAGLRPGAVKRLELEPFSANPQLDAHYLSETLREAPDSALWFSAGE